MKIRALKKGNEEYPKDWMVSHILRWVRLRVWPLYQRESIDYMPYHLPPISVTKSTTLLKKVISHTWKYENRLFLFENTEEFSSLKISIK